MVNIFKESFNACWNDKSKTKRYSFRIAVINFTISLLFASVSGWIDILVR